MGDETNREERSLYEEGNIDKSEVPGKKGDGYGHGENWPAPQGAKSDFSICGNNMHVLLIKSESGLLNLHATMIILVRETKLGLMHHLS